ncbi:MAG: metallophosphoesterase [Pseudomonadales bacterium]|nr:metallophosphoesterase [Pseudomonadales bacterium]
MNSGKGRNGLRLIHITDPHLTHLNATHFNEQKGKRRLGYLSWKRKRRRIHSAEILEKLVHSIKAHRPDQVLITGDLVHIGLPDEIQQAKSWLNALGTPDQITLVPGNHDVYQSECWRNISANWLEYLGINQAIDSDIPGDCYPVVKSFQHIQVISLSSCEAMPFYSAQGILRPEQLSRFEQILRQAEQDNRPTAWLLHHPPLKNLTAWRRALKDTRALETLIKRYQPAFVLYGHNHRNLENRIQETRVMGTASASCIYDASYRIIDLEVKESETPGSKENARKLQIKCSLRQIDTDSLTFREAAMSTWCI